MKYVSLATIAFVTASGLALAAPATARERGYARRMPSANQLINDADARIARLKADLQLTPDQQKNWQGLQDTLHEIAVARANYVTDMRQRMAQAAGKVGANNGQSQSNQSQDNSAAENGANSGNANVGAANPESSNTPSNAPSGAQGAGTPKTTNQAAQPNAVDFLRREADYLSTSGADLKKLADAAQPLYDSLDTQQRHRLIAFVAHAAFDLAVLDMGQRDMR